MILHVVNQLYFDEEKSHHPDRSAVNVSESMIDWEMPIVEGHGQLGLGLHPGF